MSEETCRTMETPGNFYGKLSGQRPISVLIAGDSIGYGSSSSVPDTSFAALFSQQLQEKFGCEVSVTNISVGGTDSLFSYVVMNRQDFACRFDLVVVCHGQNDRPEELERNYESLLRTALSQNPGCEIICLLESAQREYTEKLSAIQRLAAHYGCAVCDTLAAFRHSGRPYEELVSEDGVHPNDAGHRLYAEALLRTVEQGVSSGKSAAGERPLPAPFGRPFTSFRYIPRHKLKREGLTLSVTAVGQLFCFHVLEGLSGDPYRVVMTGMAPQVRALKHDFDWVWERMYPLPGEKSKKKTLKFILKNANDLDRIIGVTVLS